MVLPLSVFSWMRSPMMNGREEYCGGWPVERWAGSGSREREAGGKTSKGAATAVGSPLRCGGLHARLLHAPPGRPSQAPHQSLSGRCQTNERQLLTICSAETTFCMVLCAAKPTATAAARSAGGAGAEQRRVSRAASSERPSAIRMHAQVGRACKTNMAAGCMQACERTKRTGGDGAKGEQGLHVHPKRNHGSHAGGGHDALQVRTGWQGDAQVGSARLLQGARTPRKWRREGSPVPGSCAACPGTIVTSVFVPSDAEPQLGAPANRAGQGNAGPHPTQSHHTHPSEQVG